MDMFSLHLHNQELHTVKHTLTFCYDCTYFYYPMVRPEKEETRFPSMVEPDIKGKVMLEPRIVYLTYFSFPGSTAIVTNNLLFFHEV